VTEPLPELLDIAKLARELGISRAAAEAIFRQLPKVRPPDVRKVYVRRSDVARYLEDCTVAA
jgi:hypothetical protein